MWHEEPGLGWFLISGPSLTKMADKIEKKEPKGPKKTPKEPKETPKTSAMKRPASKSSKKKQDESEEEPRPRKIPSGKKTDDGTKGKDQPKRKSEKTTEEAEPKKRRSKKEKVVIPIEPAPLTKKEQRKEIIAFLEKAKDFTDENAKASLKALLPNYSANGFDCSPDIYWERKGVKGIGCGVRCQSEGKNVGYFGYRVQCDSWIYAIAAAIKSADIFVTFLHLNH